MRNIHTIVVSRHSQHNDNVPTEEWMNEVTSSSKDTKDYLNDKGVNNLNSANLIASNQWRTQETVKKIANVFSDKYDDSGCEILEVKEEKSLNLDPDSGPMKDIIEKLCEHYDQDEDVKKTGHSDKFVEKMQNGELDWVDFNKFAIFYCTKLRNVVSFLSKDKTDWDLSIMWIHGWYFWEGVISSLFWDKLPESWKWQIHMGEQAVLNVIESNWEIKLHIKYRDTEMEISKEEINNRIQYLRSVD